MSSHLAVPLVLPAGPGPVDVQGHAFTLLTDAALAGDEWDADALGRVLGWGGKLAGPHLLSDAWDGGLIDAATVAAHIGAVWSAAEYPDAELGHVRWRELFAVAGFTVDGVPAARPGGPVELWRGSVPERRTDWSWSTDWETAGRYASGYFGRPRGRLYRLTAPPGALLCSNDGRDEAEFVVDTAHPGVVITDG
ncbi:hypothetical protein [Streptomyces sp. NPDC047973]|uniref:hypothetical protein n=1 Tax=Streptomyces sp. NPDC047973 TaxID=3155383 RepID=UPI00341CE791